MSACGILCQLIQYYVSIRHHDLNRDLTGDRGVTVRWSGQPLPHLRSTTCRRAALHERDEFWEIKEKGERTTTCPR
ncbi:hypothetical protein ACNKHO_02385 [Shigella flexneri]